MKRFFFIVALLLLPTSAQATTYWGSTAGGAANCAAASGATDPGSYRTLTQGLACLAAGDTLYLKAGTYTSTITTPPSGLSASQPTIIETAPGEATAIIRPSGFGVLVSVGAARSNITFRNLVADCAVGNPSDCRGFQTSAGTVITGLVVEDYEVKNYVNDGFFIGAGTTGTFRRIHIHDGINGGTSPSNALYFQGRNSLIENVELGPNIVDAFSLRSDIGGFGNTFRNIKMHGSTQGTTAGRSINIQSKGTSAAQANIFHNLEIYDMNWNALRIQGSHTRLYNTTMYDIAGFGVTVDTGSTNNHVVNNIIRSVTGTPIINNGTGTTLTTNFCASGTSCTTSDPLLTAPASGNLTLQSTSPAIDACTSIAGFAFNGSAPDCGAHETISTAAITAVATDSSVDLTLPVNIAAALPILPASGITGFTLSDTRTVTSGTRLTDGIIRLTYTGTCTGGTVSYSPGNVTDGLSVGNPNGTVSRQPLFAFVGKAVTNACGGGTPAPPAGLHIDYALDDGSGTNANDGTANNLDGTLTDGPTWVSGHTGSAVYFAPSVQDYIAVPYGNAVNPSTQSLTIAFAVLPDANALSGNYTVFSAPAGTNQHLRVRSTEGTWTIQIQGSTLAPSTLPVTATWTHMCLVMDSGADTATLHVNGVAGTGEAVKAYTSYALAGNFDIGRISGTTNVLGFAVDDFKLWTSVESCADDFAAWSPPAPAPGGSFTQVAYQLYLARTDSAGNLLKLPNTAAALNASAVTPTGGVVAIEIQANCDNVANCDPLGMVLQRAPIGVDTWSDVPDSDIGAASFYGTSDSGSEIPSGVPTCPLSGALTCVDGGTIRTASAVPVIDLGQNESTVNRYVVKVNESSRFRLRNQDGNIFGTYSQYPTVTVVDAYAGVGM